MCDNVTSKIVPFNDIPDIIKCSQCNNNAIRQVNAPNVHYKGQGFSKTDIKKPYDPFDKDELDKGTEKTFK